MNSGTELNNCAGTVLLNGGIWDEFSEQHQHQSIIKSIIYNARFILLGLSISDIYKQYFALNSLNIWLLYRCINFSISPRGKVPTLSILDSNIIYFKNSYQCLV